MSTESPNRQAIGARVELTAGGGTQRRQVMPTRSYLSQVEPSITFGLGENDEVESLTVIWADGSEQKVETRLRRPATGDPTAIAPGRETPG